MCSSFVCLKYSELAVSGKILISHNSVTSESRLTWSNLKKET